MKSHCNETTFYFQNLVQRDRDQIYLEYQRLKKENENVKFSYEKHRIDLSKEPVFSLNIEVSESILYIILTPKFS